MRQTLRKTILFISFLLLPITLFYISPYLIVDGTFQGIASGSFVIFIILFVVSLFLGRVFCSWICPTGGLQMVCSSVRNKKAKGGRLNWIKFFIWVPWVGSIVIGLIMAGGLKQIDFFYHTQYGISVSQPGQFIIYYGVVAMLVTIALWAGRRGACHYSCHMAPFMIIGRKIRNAFKWPALELTADKAKCVNCKKCTAVCPMSLEVHEMVSQNNMENSECILCGECVDNCGQKAIRYVFAGK